MALKLRALGIGGGVWFRPYDSTQSYPIPNPSELHTGIVNRLCMLCKLRLAGKHIVYIFSTLIVCCWKILGIFNLFKSLV